MILLKTPNISSLNVFVIIKLAFGFNNDILDHDNLLFLILHGVDSIGHGLPVKINELIYYCVVNFMSQAKRFVKKSWLLKKLIDMQL